MTALAHSPFGTDRDTADPAATAARQHDRRWWILAVLAVAQLMVVLDGTVVNIALPSAQHALHFSDGDRQWIVTAYSLAFGSLLLLGGRLADLLGRKRMFLIGLVGFASASAVGGAATSFTVLVSARTVQGAFGAMLAPAGLSLLTTTFSNGSERSKAFGIYGAVAGSGAGLGLLLGGALTEYLSWRWSMYVNVLFAVVAFTGGALLLVHQRAEDRPKLDVPGVLTVSAALFSLVYGFAHAGTAGWEATETLIFLAAGIVLLGVFVWGQTRSSNPLLPLRILADRNRSGSYLAILFSGAGMFGVFLFLTYYEQTTLGYSPLRTGLSFLPMIVMLILSATVGTGILSSRVGPRWLITPGMALATAGMLLLTDIGVTPSYLTRVLPGLMVLGLGLGIVFSTAQNRATAGVQSDDAGVAAALVNTGQQIGGSLGTSLLNTLVASAIATYVAAHATGHASAAVLAHASVHGYATAFTWAAVLFAVGGVLSGMLLHGEVPAAEPDAQAEEGSHDAAAGPVTVPVS